MLELEEEIDGCRDSFITGLHNIRLEPTGEDVDVTTFPAVFEALEKIGGKRIVGIQKD